MLIDDDCLIIEDCDGFAGKTITGQQYVKVNHRLIEKALAGAGRVCYNASSENAINVLLNSSAVSRNDVYPATANGLTGVGIAAELVYKNRVLIDSDFSRNERKIVALLVNRIIMSTHRPLIGSVYCEKKYTEKEWYCAQIFVQTRANRKMVLKVRGAEICLAENISKLSDTLWRNGYFLSAVDSYQARDESIDSELDVYRRDLRARTQNDYKTIRKVIDEVLSEYNT